MQIEQEIEKMRRYNLTTSLEDAFVPMTMLFPVGRGIAAGSSHTAVISGGREFQVLSSFMTQSCAQNMLKRHLQVLDR